MPEGYKSSVFLSPIVRVVDGFRPNVELFAQSIQERFQPFYLAIGWASGFAVSYNADTDSLRTTVPGVPGDG